MQANLLQKVYKHPATKFVLIMCVAAVPMFAQGPFANTINALQTFALLFARIFAVIAIIIGGAVAAMGGHRAEGIAAMIIGVGLMAEAQNVVNWLFT